ncbi:hypothetical protein J3Q64DRAFT_1777607 [Phycomyces blakesleeanus]|uniref:Uncharacterized protein n=1 Tax=Phycomyces blakesleeanus TaxID=4837 RepID=A0ABR3AJX1_PHYBL
MKCSYTKNIVPFTMMTCIIVLTITTVIMITIIIIFKKKESKKMYVITMCFLSVCFLYFNIKVYVYALVGGC